MSALGPFCQSGPESCWVLTLAFDVVALSLGCGLKADTDSSPWGQRGMGGLPLGQPQDQGLQCQEGNPSLHGRM